MTKDISRRDALKGLALLAFSPMLGCAYRPSIKGEERYGINSDITLSEVNENVAKYYIHGVKILSEPYYHAVTPIGDALFKKGLSYKDIDLRTDKGKIKGLARRRSGEGGLYFLEHAKDANGKRIDFVSIDPQYKKAVIGNPEVIDKKGALEIFCEMERNYPFNFGLLNLKKDEPSFVIRVESDKINQKGFYNFYLTPVDGATIRTFEDGKFKIINVDNIKIPTFNSWGQIKEKISRLEEKEKQKEAEEILKSLGLLTAIDSGNLNED